MTTGNRIFRGDMSEPIQAMATVSPHDTNELANYSRALYVGTTGNLKVTTIDGYTVVLSNVPVGWLPIAVKVVWNTSTTASNIVAGW